MTLSGQTQVKAREGYDRNQKVDFRFRQRPIVGWLPQRTARGKVAARLLRYSCDLRVQSAPLRRERLDRDHGSRSQIDKRDPNPHQRARTLLVSER